MLSTFASSSTTPEQINRFLRNLVCALLGLNIQTGEYLIFFTIQNTDMLLVQVFRVRVEILPRRIPECSFVSVHR